MVNRNLEWESENQENVSGEPFRDNPGWSWRDMWVHFGGWEGLRCYVSGREFLFTMELPFESSWIGWSFLWEGQILVG